MIGLRFLNKFSKRAKIVYITIGVLFYIFFGWSVGFTSLVVGVIEDVRIRDDYIDEIKEVYINDEKDIYLCVLGNTLDKKDIEFWAVIPHDYYIPDPVREKRFKEKMYNRDNFNTSAISHDRIIISECKIPPVKGLKKFDISVIPIVGKDHDKTQKLVNEITDSATFGKLIHMKYKHGFTQSSKLIYVWYDDTGEKYTIWFWNQSIGHPELVSPLWYLLYIPAILLDILLWPIWVLIFLSYIGTRPI